jgi:hypothetical protein
VETYNTNTIRLADALRLMDQVNPRTMEPARFDVGFYTANRAKNTGGQYLEIQGACLTKHVKGLPMHMRRVDGFSGSKSSRHYENATRNLSAPDGTITKIHIRLLKKFNGMTVIW